MTDLTLEDATREPRQRRSSLHRLVVGQLVEAAAPEDLATWIARHAGISRSAARAVAAGRRSMTLDVADRLLRTYCRTSLVELAVATARPGL